MPNNTHQMISDRAYALWENEGRPAARSATHWLAAEREILAVLVKPVVAAKPKATKRAPRKKAAPKRVRKSAA